MLTPAIFSNWQQGVVYISFFFYQSGSQVSVQFLICQLGLLLDKHLDNQYQQSDRRFSLNVKYLRIFSTSTSLVFFPRPGGSGVFSWPGGYEFDPWLRRLFFPAYFRLSPMQKHVRKVVVALERKVELVLVWESQETHMRHRPPWYDLSC